MKGAPHLGSIFPSGSPPIAFSVFPPPLQAGVRNLSQVLDGVEADVPSFLALQGSLLFYIFPSLVKDGNFTDRLFFFWSPIFFLFPMTDRYFFSFSRLFEELETQIGRRRISSSHDVGWGIWVFFYFLDSLYVLNYFLLVERVERTFFFSLFGTRMRVVQLAYAYFETFLPVFFFFSFCF